MEKRPLWIPAVAWIGFGLLLVLHLDSWRTPRSDLWLGWVPHELAWRLGWMALAWLYLVFFCGTIWKDDPEDEAR